MGSPPTLDPSPTRPPATNRHLHDGQDELLGHLQTPAAFGGHEFGDWPVDHIASGFGGDLKRFAPSNDRIGAVLAAWRHETNRLPPQRPWSA
jgi:hypothetical protein